MANVGTTSLYAYMVASGNLPFESLSSFGQVFTVEQYSKESVFIDEGSTFESLSSIGHGFSVGQYNNESVSIDTENAFESVSKPTFFIVPKKTLISEDIVNMSGVPSCASQEFLESECIYVNNRQYSVDNTSFISYRESRSLPLPIVNRGGDNLFVSYSSFSDVLTQEQFFVDPTSVPPIVTIEHSIAIPIMDAHKNDAHGFKYMSSNMFFWEGYIYRFTGLFAIISKRINRLIYPKSKITVTGRKRKISC